MDSIFKTAWSGHNGHPSEDDLLLFVDGELATKTAATIRTHLEACWSCRVRTEKIEEAISTFIDYRNQVLKPLADPPPRSWRGFDGRLNGLSAEVGGPSLIANLRSTLGRIFSAPSISINLRTLLRPVAVALTVLLVAAVLLRFNNPSIVSASEVLNRVAAAQLREIETTNQPVVYQKLQVRKKAANSVSETVTWEVWNDTINGRTRRSIEDVNGQHLLPIETIDSQNSSSSNLTATHPMQISPSAVMELNTVLRTNHMNPAMPLSASSFEGWRRSVEPKEEEVTKSTAINGQRALTLRTTATGQLAQGEIVEASLVVREGDWHPIEERLRVRSDQADVEFEIIEAGYSVISLNTLSPTIFNDEPIVAPSPTVSPITPKRETELSSSPNFQPLIPAAFASADLEVEVLSLLNQAGADLGEQVSATRAPDGLLHVAGIVDSPQRKSEILHSLEPVANNPAVKIEIQTVTEAVEQQQQQRSRANATPEPITQENIEINTEAIAAAPELRSYFSSDEEVRQFAARMVSRSRGAMNHVFALKRLLTRLSSEDLRTLSPEGRTKLIMLIRTHARAYQNAVEGIRRDLQPIFFPGTSSTGVQNGKDITETATLVGAVEELFDLASSNDGVIRSAFATSTEAVAATAIRSPQFRHSLRNAEGLAARIQSVKLD